ncbi:MAG: alpha/beta fold hydrolase [Solirubrobacterales bacterium]
MDFTASSGGVSLAGTRSGGEGPPIVLLHGLTATRDVVVHGSSHLARQGFDVVSYDARGHGGSEAPEPGAYGYVNLADDAQAVLAAQTGDARPVLAGHSMGAHTIAALALRDPARFAGLVLIGPAVIGEEPGPESVEGWDRLADGLEAGGVEGFVQAYDQGLDPGWRETLLRIARKRLAQHAEPEGVVRALREVPRSIPFAGLSALEALDVPALVVASHDEADPGHPYAVAEAWANALPRASLTSEATGASPLAWQGGKLSRVIEAFCDSPEVGERR